MAVGKDSFADRSLGRSAKSMFAIVFGRWQRVLAVGKAEFSCSVGSIYNYEMYLKKIKCIYFFCPHEDIPSKEIDQ
jgi:hypothetical protein